MYYELYIDVFFVINMVMDYILLRLVNMLLKGSATHLRSIAGAAIGALGMCLIIILPIQSRLVQLCFMHLCISVIMVWVGCECKGKKILARGVLVLYLVSFLFGGFLQVLLTYTQMGAITREVLLGKSAAMVGLRTFFFLGTISYVVITIGIKLYGCLKGKVSNICDVTLYVNGNCEKVKGLYDTGNHLRDTVTGKPVSVVDSNLFIGLLNQAEYESLIKGMQYGEFPETICRLRPHYVLFHSVGKEHGLLLAITLEKLCIDVDGRMLTVKDPVVALSKEVLSDTKDFQIVINPSIVDS